MTHKLASRKKYSVLLGKVGLIADSPDERAGTGNMLGLHAQRLRCVPSMFDSLGVKVPYPT